MDMSQPANPNSVYDWERFWVRRGDPIVLTQRGYLPDLRYDREHPSAHPVVRFADIESVPCLALLGEPGMGKTTALDMERPTIAERVLKEGGVPFWLRLRGYTSDMGLVSDLFRGQAFDAWAGGDYTLHIFLDDFDECHLRIETLAVLLVDQLRRYSVNAIRHRLRLRIACRTAAWPASLEDGLKELWGRDAFGAYELAPLREQDVAAATTAHGLDSEAFLLAVDRAEVSPLASRPLTLDFLLRLHQQTGGFPSNRADLYAQGCE